MQADPDYTPLCRIHQSPYGLVSVLLNIQIHAGWGERCAICHVQRSCCSSAIFGILGRRDETIGLLGMDRWICCSLFVARQLAFRPAPSSAESTAYLIDQI